jgi:hypothetical protein
LRPNQASSAAKTSKKGAESEGMSANFNSLLKSHWPFISVRQISSR